jgi:hypothetical protein
VFAVAAVVSATVNAGFWFFAGIFGLLAVAGVGVGLLTRSQAGQRMLGLSAAGVLVIRFAEAIPWGEVVRISAVRFDNSARVRGLGGAVAAAGMRLGGVNDGGRAINVVVRDPAAAKARAGRALEFMIQQPLPFEEKGVAGVHVLLSNALTEPQFAALLAGVRAEADAHGVAFWEATA